MIQDYDKVKYKGNYYFVTDVKKRVLKVRRIIEYGKNSEKLSPTIKSIPNNNQVEVLN